MDTLITAFTGFLFFQGLLLTILLLNKSRRDTRTASPLLLGILILYYSLISLNLLLDQAYLTGMPLPCCLSGTLIYLYIRCSRDKNRPGPRDALLFVPALFTLAFHMIPLPEEKGCELLQLSTGIWDLFLSGTALYLSFRWRRDFKKEYSEAPGFGFLILPVTAVLAAFLTILDPLLLIVNKELLSDISSLALSVPEAAFIFIPGWYLLYQKESLASSLSYVPPTPTDNPILPGKKTKYARDLLDDSLLKVYGETLNRVMVEDEIYRESGLSLARLASLTNIPPVQLSQVINRREGLNFFQYVNRMRVNEACRLLKADGSKTILEIMYEVGFNSKSTFNTAFKNQTGSTPGAYRRQL